MLTNSLFFDFLMEQGMEVYKGKSTRDVICLEFGYGSRSYEQELAHLNKIKEKSPGANYYLERIIENADKFDKRSAGEIRDIFYNNGVDIHYPGGINIHYKMLYRTPGKAKKGSCMFICDRLYDVARDFLYMGIKLPDHNAPIVEIGAYSSLITSTIVDRIHIDPSEILVLKDVDAKFVTNIVSVELNENKECVAVEKDNYSIKNTLFDGQALIDSSIFPEDGDGYILLRHHFTKMAAFCTNIQLFFQDYFGDQYEHATVVDMFGNLVQVNKIKLITTENAVKWLKFGITYEYWSEWVRKNGSMFGIVKTAHESKLGDVQRMSYQMVNALSIDIMKEVMQTSVDYIISLKADDANFIEFLRKNSNFSNDYDALIALCEANPLFVRSSLFRERKKFIINTGYVQNLKCGKTIQNADNLVIVGSPYAMLLHAVGEDALSDPTFTQEEDAIQCWTARFDDGAYLAEFRSPFNSRNNLGHMHNVHHPYFDKYFNLGKLIIAVNMIGTDFQDKNNGSDQDSDSLYVTDQKQIVDHARYCHNNYRTIVNNIPKEPNHYNNTMSDFATVDNNLAAAQLDIGESSNLAQLCLTYTYNFPDKKYEDYVCILSVLAQASIDSAKRRFDVNIHDEIHRIKNDMDVKNNKYPEFWLAIRKGFNKEMINRNLICPMNELYNVKLPYIRSADSIIPLKDFFVNYEEPETIKVSKKVEELINKYSIELMKFNTSSKNDEYILLKSDFEDMVEDIRKTALPSKYTYIFAWLINKAFILTAEVPNDKSNIICKNKSLLMKTLYEVNKEAFLNVFSNKVVL